MLSHSPEVIIKLDKELSKIVIKFYSTLYSVNRLIATKRDDSPFQNGRDLMIRQGIHVLNNDILPELKKKLKEELQN